MFEQTFIASEETKRDRSIAFALLIQAVAVTGLVLLPLLGVPSIEAGKRFQILAPGVKKEPKPTQRTAAARSSSPSAPRSTVFKIPTPHSTDVPHASAILLSDAPAIAGIASSQGSDSGVMGSISQALEPPAPPVRPVPKRKPDPTPMRVSSRVSQSQLIFGPKPPYPRLALTARVEGTVKLQATISREGRIENLHVLSGHPILAGPAMDAVREWRYHPVLLNGDPVEAITEIDVTFTLTQ